MDHEHGLMSSGAHAAALWIGLNLLLLLALALMVVRQRNKHKVLIGDGGVEELTRVGRVFGNAAEYVPAGMAAMAALALVGFSALLIHAVGALLFFGRLAHAFGLGRSIGVTPGRALGMAATWIAFLVAGVALIWCALS